MGAFALLCTGLGSGRLHAEGAARSCWRDAIAIDRRAVRAAACRHHLHAWCCACSAPTDLVGRIVAAIPGGEITAVAVVLALIGLCAFVLDAFEIIFVIVPIVMPPLLIASPTRAGSRCWCS